MTNTIDKAILLGQILAWGNCRATCAMDTKSSWGEVVKSLDALETLLRDYGVAWLLVDQQKDRLAELDLSETQLIQERDKREEVIDALCDAVLGTDRPEWSSAYSFDDAVEEVAVKTAVLDKEVSELYALRARVAELASQFETRADYVGQLKSERDAIAAELAAIKAQEPVAKVTVGPHDHGPFTFTETAHGADSLMEGDHQLYLEPQTPPGSIRALKYRIHELEGEVIGYKQILDAQEPTPISQAVRDYNEVVDKYNKLLAPTPPVREINWSELVAWWESGAEQWDGLKDIVSRMVQPVREPLSEQQVDYEKAADWLAGHAQGLIDGKAIRTCKKCKEPISEIADCNSATCPTMQDFNSWWYASKYMQVVNASSGTRQAAIDGWNAAIEAAIKEQK